MILNLLSIFAGKVLQVEGYNVYIAKLRFLIYF